MIFDFFDTIFCKILKLFHFKTHRKNAIKCLDQNIGYVAIFVHPAAKNQLYS